MLLATDLMTNLMVTALTTDNLGTCYYSHTVDRPYDEHKSKASRDFHPRDNI